MIAVPSEVAVLIVAIAALIVGHWWRQWRFARRANIEWSQPGGKIYFAYASLRRNGQPYAIKIGFTKGPVANRIRALDGTATAGWLRAEAVIAGDRMLERQLHERFAAERIRADREWFHPSRRLLDFVAHLRRHGPAAMMPPDGHETPEIRPEAPVRNAQDVGDLKRRKTASQRVSLGLRPKPQVRRSPKMRSNTS